MKKLNKSLVKQLEDNLGDECINDPRLLPLLESMSDLFDQLEKEKQDLQYTIELSSNELVKLNKSLREERDNVKQAHDELGTLLKNIDQVVYSVDMTSRTTRFISPTCIKVYGYPDKDFLKDPDLWYKVILDEDKPIIDGNYPKMNAGLSFTQEYRIRHKSGEIRWLQSAMKPELDANGKLIVLYGVTSDITDRKLAEAELELSRMRLLRSQQIAKIGSWEFRLEPDGTATGLKWSDETYRILGYRPNQLEPTFNALLDSVTPDDRERVISVFRGTILRGRPFEIEHKIVTHNGVEKTVYQRAQLELDNSGNPVKLIGTAQDITDVKVSRQDLIRAKANLNNILENTDTGYILLDTNMNIKTYNSVARQLVKKLAGVNVKQGVGYLETLSPGRGDFVEKSISWVLETGQPTTYEVKYDSRQGGKNTWLSCGIYPIFDQSDKVIGLSVSARDVTLQKAKEIETRLSNERYELVGKATKDIIWDWDLIEDKIYRSDNYKLLVNGTESNHIDGHHSWIDTVHPEDRARLMDKINNALENSKEGFWEDDYRLVDHDGNIKFVNDKGYVIFDEQGQGIRMVGAMRDITSKKQAELERERISQDLIRQNEDLEQFAYIVSHNLRAPVANIIGLTDLLDTDDPEGNKTIIGMLKKAAGNLDEIIKDLNEVLDIKKHKGGSKETFNLSQILEDIVTSVQQWFDSEQVILNTNLDAVDEVTSIKSYLYSILYNLVTNSIKYRREDVRPQIEIKTEQLNDSIVIHYKDNGLGINMDKYGDSVFGLYKRFSPEANREGKGMGLFMVKRQVEALDGTINLTSAVNEGCYFRIEMKL